MLISSSFYLFILLGRSVVLLFVVLVFVVIGWWHCCSCRFCYKPPLFLCYRLVMCCFSFHPTPSYLSIYRPFLDNKFAQAIYFFKAWYFVVSSLQIISGYPHRVLGYFWGKSTDLISGTILQMWVLSQCRSCTYTYIWVTHCRWSHIPRHEYTAMCCIRRYTRTYFPFTILI